MVCKILMILWMLSKMFICQIKHFIRWILWKCVIKELLKYNSKLVNNKSNLYCYMIVLDNQYYIRIDENL